MSELNVTVGFQTTEGGRFYEVNLGPTQGARVIGGEKWDSLNPLEQSLALGIIGDMMSVAYAKSAHILKVDFDARMNDLKAQLAALTRDD